LKKSKTSIDESEKLKGSSILKATSSKLEKESELSFKGTESGQTTSMKLLSKLQD